MIFVSTSCIKAKTIKESILALVKEGFVNIELSGGTEYFDDYVYDLLDLKSQYSLQYLVHNYFPPPRQHFMLNLASLNDDMYIRSIRHCKAAISLCKKIGSPKYGIHAGFLIDILPKEAGKRIGLKRLNSREEALCRFCDAWKILNEYAQDDVKLYIENNVFSQSNKQTYNDSNPFLLTDYDGYLEIKERVDFNILLDLAHLKVSCNSLKQSFNEQVAKIFPLTDYYHISGNDGLHDQNNDLNMDSIMVNILESYDFSLSTVTLEVYESVSSLKNSFNIIKDKIASRSGPPPIQ
jgi:sugar phosphate isomerase/epimerase